MLEYLTAEILELAGNAALDHKCRMITPRHITLGIRHDAELNKMLPRSTVAGGGVLPRIPPYLRRDGQDQFNLNFAKINSDMLAESRATAYVLAGHNLPVKSGGVVVDPLTGVYVAAKSTNNEGQWEAAQEGDTQLVSRTDIDATPTWISREGLGDEPQRQNARIRDRDGHIPEETWTARQEQRARMKRALLAGDTFAAGGPASLVLSRLVRAVRARSSCDTLALAKSVLKASPGEMLLSCIHREQRATNLIFGRASFIRLVAAMVRLDVGAKTRGAATRRDTPRRFTPEALGAIQTATEGYLLELFVDAQLAALHDGERTHVRARDLQLALHLRGERDLESTS